MTSRRNLVVAASTLAVAFTGIGHALAQTAQKPPKQGDFLFVQTARGMTFDPATNNIVLEGVSPVTLFFSDRPERIAGNMKTTAFVPFWSDGKNSFLSDPPNADISVLEGATLKQIVAVLRDPVLEGDNLRYTVKVLQGEMPLKAADVSVFIDVFGMPMTPISYAGFARRRYRWAWMYR